MNPGSLCSCRGGISCRPKRPPRNGKRHETEGGMRCRHYRRGVAEGEGQEKAPAYGATIRAPAGGAAPLRSCRAVGRVSSNRRNPTPQPLVGLRDANPTYNDCHSRVRGNPVSLCSCRGGISCRPKRRQRNGQRHRMARLRKRGSIGRRKAA